MPSKETNELFKGLPFKIYTKKTVTSTNTLLKELAEQGESDRTVIIAEAQTEGRGRLGRRFESPCGAGLYMSVLFRPDAKAEDALFMTISTAVGVARAIEKLAREEKNEIRAKIKWVNDIFINNLKVCGILTEASLNIKNGGLDYAVIGIGINLFSSDVTDKKLSGVAGFVFDRKVPDAANRLAAEILKQLDDVLFAQDQSVILDEYRSRSYLDGKSVTVLRGNEEFSAEVIGIDDSARLIVKTADGKETALSSGEVSIRTSDNKNMP